ncbi:MAG: hypothetical protein JTT11_09220 [Candidatus Brockarchaeota archaeon]|nr:hypothetical protein [Candidatus Brockarchaeota archaeon]
MAEATPEASGNFVHRVKELLEAITGKPYGIMEKQHLEGRIWGVYLDENKVEFSESISMNRGAQWVYEDKDGNIQVLSDKFLDITDLASDLYDFDFKDTDVLLDRKKWEKYKKELPRLITELEATERIANELNRKHGTNITIWSGEKPYFRTGFNAKGMSEEEKLREIGKHVKAMLIMWKRRDKWVVTEGAEMYKKEERSRMNMVKFREAVISRLQDITKSEYTKGYKKELLSGVLWSVVGWCEDKKGFNANRGVWYVKETKEGIAIFSDNFETINASNELEYNSIKLMGGVTAGDYEARLNSAFQYYSDVDERGWKIARPITKQDATKYGRKATISPKLLEDVAKQASKEFNVDIRLMKDRPVLMAEFKTKGLKRSEKLREIERRAKALAEAWSRVKELSKGEADAKA